MSNILIAKPQYSDAATITGDNVEPDYPIENALTQQPRDVVRASSTSLTVDIDLARPVASLSDFANTSPSPIIYSSTSIDWTTGNADTEATGLTIADLWTEQRHISSGGAADTNAVNTSLTPTSGDAWYLTWIVRAGTSGNVEFRVRDAGGSPLLSVRVGGTLGALAELSDPLGLDICGVINGIEEEQIDAALNLWKIKFTVVWTVTPTQAWINIGPYTATSGDDVKALAVYISNAPGELLDITDTVPVNFIGCLYNNAPEKATWRARGAHYADAFTAMAAADRFNGTDLDLDFTGWTIGAKAVSSKRSSASDRPAHYVLSDNQEGGTNTNVYLLRAVDFTDNVKHRFFAWVEAKGASQAGLRTFNYGASIAGTSIFDISTGSISSEDANHTATISAHPMYPDIYKIQIEFGPATESPIDLTGSLRLHVADGGDTTVDLDGTSSIRVYAAGVYAVATGDTWEFDSLQQRMWNEDDYKDWDRRHSTILPSTAQSYRFWRIDFEDIDSTFQFGRLLIDDAYQNTDRDADIGLKLGWQDASFGISTEGAHYRRQGRQWRNLACRFSFRFETEAFDDFMAMDKDIARGGSVFAMIDPENRIMEQSIYGYLGELFETDYGVWNIANASNLYSKQYLIVEFEKP